MNAPDAVLRELDAARRFVRSNLPVLQAAWSEGGHLTGLGKPPPVDAEANRRWAEAVGRGAPLAMPGNYARWLLWVEFTVVAIHGPEREAFLQRRFVRMLVEVRRMLVGHRPGRARLRPPDPPTMSGSPVGQPPFPDCIDPTVPPYLGTPVPGSRVEPGLEHDPRMLDAHLPPLARSETAPAGRERAPASVAPIIAELCMCWGAQAVAARTTFVFDTRLRRTLGCADLRTGRITLAPRLLNEPRLLREVIAHEFAHVVAFERVGASERTHGPTWAGLMRAVGLDARIRIPWSVPDRAIAAASASRFVHRCPVCQASRRARRPMPAWRCIDCSAAGLPGVLEVTREPSRR